MTQFADLPQDAVNRLENMKKGNRLFTSDLSVNEFLLVHEAGFDPVGLVVGSSIYHIGYQRVKWTQSAELTVLSQAMYNARELAMSRMLEEAQALDADGVVGVRLDVSHGRWGESVAEFIAIGTAIKARDNRKWKAPDGRPFASDLSGQDFWVLLRSGHRPVGMTMGTCVYGVAHQGMLQAWGNIGKNVELTNFTQALYDARELAMSRMQSDAERVQAKGIVGVRLDEKNYGWESHVIEFFAIGTAIVSMEDEWGEDVPAPQLTLPLNDY
ncbi:MAG: heavy metal-binding domain-containing protein [Peptococcaceae bacterium]|jgi:uncharacterized protein YbjQ (UPF0145 family)|nr:heavy metal-binding domain-containing protein [Peptococcaceae bacterium]